MKKLYVFIPKLVKSDFDVYNLIETRSPWWIILYNSQKNVCMDQIERHILHYHEDFIKNRIEHAKDIHL